MYKSKLQELCHQRSWNLPEYTSAREGPDHNPSFQASVKVNGLSFVCSSPSRSSKLAQNDAAFIAFTHFSSPPPPPPPSLVNKLCSDEGTSIQQKLPESIQTQGASVVNVAIDVDGLVGISPLVKAPETSPTPANEGVAVAERVNTFIGDGSSTVTNELHNSGHTTQNPVETNQSQTQISEVVAIAKNENNSMGSTIINALNNSGLTAQNALETSQTQWSGFVAVAKNENSSMGTKLQQRAPEMNPTVRNETVAANTNNNFMEMQHLYKNQLQSYTQKRNLNLPVYSCERDGPPHASRFRCKVMVDGKTYGSQEFYPSLNKAELAAARVALMSLLPNGVEQDDFGYKNLLQELAQKKGYPLPNYTTSKSGKDNAPTFVSNVEVGGECFIGQEARSKKQAEVSAAKVAYTTLKQRNSFIKPTPSPTPSQVQEATHASSTSQLDFTGNSYLGLATKQLVSNKRADLAGNSNENLVCLAPSPKRQEVQFPSSSNRAEYLAHLRQHVQPTIPQVEVYPGLDRSSTSRSVSSSSGTSIGSLNEFGQSLQACAANSSAGSTICSSIEHLVKASTTCKTGVIVRPRQSSMSYPSGSAVLPFSNDDWVAVEVTPDATNT